jgi:hypothetical protein
VRGVFAAIRCHIGSFNLTNDALTTVKKRAAGSTQAAPREGTKRSPLSAKLEGGRHAIAQERGQ